MTDLLWVIQRVTWVDLLDILLVAIIFFVILYLVRRTRAVPLLRGIILLLILLSILGSVFSLQAFEWLIDRALPALLVAIPVVFQPELRRALERLGRAGSFLGNPTRNRADIDRAITSVVEASRILARRRMGALIVFERETGLQEFVETGILMNAEPSHELLVSLFDPHVALHDGAIILRNGQVLAAACVLPLSTAFLDDRRLGLRHRAALGITEDTDAIAVVVSEERGTIAVAHNGRMIRDLDPERLERVLRAFHRPLFETRRPAWLRRRSAPPKEEV